MVEYLKKHYDQHLMFNDKTVKGEACLKYRPDTMYSDPNRVVHVSCDEFQHQHQNGDYKCDEKRMSDLYDEYPGKTVIWIRWNPHAYKPPEGLKRKNLKKRLEKLVEVLKRIETRKFETKMYVIYMFYDKDNPRIVKNIAHSFEY
jgi:hypothetical protein